MERAIPILPAEDLAVAKTFYVHGSQELLPTTEQTRTKESGRKCETFRAQRQRRQARATLCSACHCVSGGMHGFRCASVIGVLRLNPSVETV